MEEEKILNVTQLGVVDKLQNEDVILLIRNTDNGKQCFQIKGFDFRGESAYEAAQSQGFVGTYQDWTQHIKEITKYKSKPKTQYIIGKAIPIGKLNGGARHNAYIVTSNILRFKLSRIPQLRGIISGEVIYDVPTYKKVKELLEGVTWHLFVDNEELTITNVSLAYNGNVLQLQAELGNMGFYKLDENKSSVNLSSDMYIYLTTASDNNLQNAKGTSKTLYYYNYQRIWEHKIQLPTYITKETNLGEYRWMGAALQLQKLLTRQKRSIFSNSPTVNISKFGYRGNLVKRPISQYGIYRYRFVKNGKKTQWRIIHILENDYYWMIR